MVKGVIAIAAVIVGLMVGIRDGRLLHMTGLTGSCTVVETLPDGTQWEACRPGKLDGRPDLSGHSCRSAGVTGTYEYWHCPAPIASQTGN